MDQNSLRALPSDFSLGQLLILCPSIKFSKVELQYRASWTVLMEAGVLFLILFNLKILTLLLKLH